jgi:mRNA interferase RelE/StbE
MYSIDWKPKARKQLFKLKDTSARERIFDAVDTLVNFPNCQSIKRLENHRHEYRLRVGSYRVLFDVRTSIRIIEIQEVKKRDEHTY